MGKLRLGGEGRLSACRAIVPLTLQSSPAGKEVRSAADGSLRLLACWEIGGWLLLLLPCQCPCGVVPSWLLKMKREDSGVGSAQSRLTGSHLGTTLRPEAIPPPKSPTPAQSHQLNVSVPHGSTQGGRKGCSSSEVAGP